MFRSTIRRFLNEECGAVLTTELILVTTVVVLGLVAGLGQLRDAVNAELADVAGAIHSLDQSFSVNGSDFQD